ncbi:hypothetical protein F52700_9396 [Fusarium sp. NRRL 52700]|nr:hypothetical protein F52700_9396 [Fusarium sp. NRRL 52700]
MVMVSSKFKFKSSLNFPSSDSGEDSDAEDDLDGFYSEEGEEDEEEEISDVASNLFECSNISIDNGDEESCIRSFDSQRDQIEHIKHCPALEPHRTIRQSTRHIDAVQFVKHVNSGISTVARDSDHFDPSINRL